MVQGPYRLSVVDWLREQAKESLMHAEMVGEHITSLGEHPTLKIGELLETHKHSTEDILNECLEHERSAIKAYYNLLENIDGKSIIPYLNDPTNNGTRQNAIPFLDNKKMAWIEGDVKFIINKNGEPKEAYNMISDRPESTDLIANYNATDIQKIWDDCIAWNSSVNKSYWGLDYVPEPFTPSESIIVVIYAT